MRKGAEHRYFTKEFKLETVRLMNEGKRSVGDIARDLDIHPNQLHEWRRKYRADMECESACNNDPPIGKIGIQN